MKNPSIYELGYIDIQIACREIIKQLKKKRKKIDVVVGIGRGGLIPATIIANALKVRVYNYGVESYKDKKRSKVEYYQLPSFVDLSSHKILLVDDLSDSGHSLTYCKSMLDCFTVKSKVYTATCYIKTGTKFVPDFYFEEVPKKLWLQFPWEALLT